mmetsp:Transcript_123858/g.194279  ORF Transcript_123858/g.194279 Transcript_123858/m.194279 type:complete len:255 (+) Transcript_123858:41-805(+)
MAPFLAPFGAAAAECGGRGCGVPFGVLPVLSTAFTQSLESEVQVGHDEFPHLERGLMEADIHPDDHQNAHHSHSATHFFAENPIQVAESHASFFDSPSTSLTTIPSSSLIEHGSHSASSHDASSFLASGVRELTPDELALRSTQLRVAFGVSSATFLTSVGVATNFIVKLARKHLAEMESDEENENGESSDEGEQHEADLSAGQKAAVLRSDRPRITIHNQALPSKIVEVPVETALDPTRDHPVESNEEVTAYY